MRAPKQVGKRRCKCADSITASNPTTFFSCCLFVRIFTKLAEKQVVKEIDVRKKKEAFQYLRVNCKREKEKDLVRPLNWSSRWCWSWSWSWRCWCWWCLEGLKFHLTQFWFLCGFNCTRWMNLFLKAIYFFWCFLRICHRDNRKSLSERLSRNKNNQ